MAIKPLAGMGAAATLTGTEIFYAQQAGVDTKVTTTQIRPPGTIDVLSYGAKGDGSTDDTAAIQAAIAATPAGGTLIFPTGAYRVVGSGTTIFTRATAIRIIGVGAPVIVPDATVPTTRDVFTFAPLTGTYGWEVSNLLIQGASGCCRYGLHIDCTQNGSTGLMYAVYIHDNIILGLGAQSMYIDCTGNSTGGFFNSVIARNFIESIYLISCGDELNFYHNTINNPNLTGIACLYFWQAVGSACFSIVENSFAGYCGHIIVDGGCMPRIVGNELETPLASTNLAGYLIRVAGGLTVYAPQILDNSFAVLAGSGNPTPLVLHSCQNARVSGGRMSVISGAHIVIDSGSTDAHIDTWSIQGYTNAVTPTAAPWVTITDNGTRTILRDGPGRSSLYAWTTISVFSGLWASGFSAGAFAAPSYRLSTDNRHVELTGMINSGVSGTVAFNLPAGFRPPSIHYFMQTDINSGNFIFVEIVPTGDVTIYGGANPDNRCLDCSFPLDI